MAQCVPKLVVIVPVFNEVRTMEEVLRRLVSEQTSKEIIVVDDGSTDGTADLLQRWQASWQEKSLPPHISRMVIITHETNTGKGAAIRTGLESALAEFVVIQDADLEVSPEAYSYLLKPLLADEADFVIGNRTELTRSAGRLGHRTGVAVLNCLVRILYGIRVQDEACCFKVLRTRDLKRMNLQCQRFEFCPEVIAKAARLGLRFAEIPVAYNPRIVAEGKKLRLRDGLLAISTLWKHRRWREESVTAERCERSQALDLKRDQMTKTS